MAAPSTHSAKIRKNKIYLDHEGFKNLHGLATMTAKQAAQSPRSQTGTARLLVCQQKSKAPVFHGLLNLHNAFSLADDNYNKGVAQSP